MPRRGHDLYGTAAEIEALTVVRISADLPRTSFIGFRIDALRQGAADMFGSDLKLRGITRAPRVRARVVGIHAVNGVKLPVAAYMILMRVRIEHDHRQRGQLRDDFLDVADAHARIELKGAR